MRSTQFLKEQLAARNKALFGDSSERRKSAGGKPSTTTKPQTGHGPRKQEALPIVELVHELDEPYQPEAGEILDLIHDLYAVEAEVRSLSAEKRLIKLRALRDARSREIIAQIYRWLLSRKVLKQSSLGKAIAYTGGLWPGLIRFLDDPAIPLDNNHTERAIRGIAVGRKNLYGSRSERGTKVAALFYTLIESAKLVGLKPRAYLSEATRWSILTPGTVMDSPARMVPASELDSESKGWRNDEEAIYGRADYSSLAGSGVGRKYSRSVPGE